MAICASTSQATNWEHAIKGCTAGGAAAAIGKTTLAPVDRVKLMLQLQNGTIIVDRQYAGMIDCLRRTCHEQGVLSLWRGNSASIARCFPSYALNFAFRDYFRAIFLTDVDKHRQRLRFAFGNIAAGGLGGAAALVICYPLDFARTRLAVDVRKDGSRQFKGVRHCITSVYAKDGILGWYRGFVVSLQFIAASRAVFFGLFDTIRLSIADDSRQLSFVSLWCLAQTCIVASSFACYPLDTVRRRLMLDVGRDKKVYSSSLDCWQKIIRQEGIRSLFKGVMTNSLKTTSGAMVLAIYYEVLKYM